MPAQDRKFPLPENVSDLHPVEPVNMGHLPPQIAPLTNQKYAP